MPPKRKLPSIPDRPCLNKECRDYPTKKNSVCQAGYTDRRKTTMKFRCRTCRAEFSEHVGTLSYRLKLPKAKQLAIAQNLAAGMSLRATAENATTRQGTVIEYRDRWENNVSPGLLLGDHEEIDFYRDCLEEFIRTVFTKTVAIKWLTRLRDLGHDVSERQIWRAGITRWAQKSKPFLKIVRRRGLPLYLRKVIIPALQCGVPVSGAAESFGRWDWTSKAQPEVPRP